MKNCPETEIRLQFQTKELLVKLIPQCETAMGELMKQTLTKEQIHDVMHLTQFYKELKNTIEIYEKKIHLKEKYTRLQKQNGFK